MGGEALREELPVNSGMRWRIRGRMLLLQGAWNYERMQNVGFAWSLDPWLSNIYKGRREALLEARLRHFGTFSGTEASDAQIKCDIAARLGQLLTRFTFGDGVDPFDDQAVFDNEIDSIRNGQPNLFVNQGETDLAFNMRSDGIQLVEQTGLICTFKGPGSDRGVHFHCGFDHRVTGFVGTHTGFAFVSFVSFVVIQCW